MLAPGSRIPLVTEDFPLTDGFARLDRCLDPLAMEVCLSAEEACSVLNDSEHAMVLIAVHAAQYGEDVWAVNCIHDLKERDPNCLVLVVAEEYDPHQAFRLLQAGATEYSCVLEHFARFANLIDLLTRCGPNEDCERPTRKCEALGSWLFSSDFMISVGILDLLEPLRQISSQPTTVLLEGEAGTGKTSLARFIHELSPRRNQPFRVIDCNSLSENGTGSELFESFENGFAGTLFLNNVNSLPMGLQEELVPVVTRHTYPPVGRTKTLCVNPRVIAGSNAKSLSEEVVQERFRKDLYQRLSSFGFYLPPLRELRNRILPLAIRLIVGFAKEYERDIKGIQPEALRALAEYNWPGNIRELRCVFEKVVSRISYKEIQLCDLPDRILRKSENLWAWIGEPSPGELQDPIWKFGQAVEMNHIWESLWKHNTNQLPVIDALGARRIGPRSKLRVSRFLRAR